MSVRLPILDNRSYAQLRDELVARIPVYAPEWTDHHPSDPGITLIELFAFLGENLLYRFNQIPDATKLAFLELLEIPVRPAESSHGLVRFESPGGDDKVDAPLATRVLAGDVPFQTRDEVQVWALQARAAVRQIVDEALDVETNEFVNRTAASVGVSTESASLYRTMFGGADPSKPGGDILDPLTSIDGAIYVALTRDEPGLPAMQGEVLTIGVVPSTESPTMAQRADEPCPGDGIEPPTPPMQWQIATTMPATETGDGASPDPIWFDLDVVGDTTAGMTRQGVVQLRMPGDLTDIGIFVPSDPDARGAGDQPPLVEDPEIDATLRAWLRVFRPRGGDLPAVEWLGVNATRVEQALSASAEFLGFGTGDPNQTVSLVHRNVLGDVELDVEEIGQSRWLPWVQVADFSASGVDDRHFVVDREAGTITCGDGRRGRIWQIGERVRCRHYTHGGGASGNVGPDAISKVRDIPGIGVANPLATRGGADAEPLADAVARIPSEFGRRDRAVTVSDFRELAEATPGAGIARAETLRLFDPRNPSVESAGNVSVVVWPGHDRDNPSAPRPDRETLNAVCKYIDARRLITTEVHVLPPTYRKVALSIGIRVKPGHGIESVRRWVELVLRQYLAPLPPYGPEGRGWPLGRRLYAPELEAAALQVEGVEYLVPGTIEGSDCPIALRLADLDGEGNWIEPRDRTIILQPWEVPELAEITVVDGEPLAPGEGLVLTSSAGTALPVRSPMEVC